MSNMQKSVTLIENDVITGYEKVEDLVDQAEHDIRTNVKKFFRDLINGVYDEIPIEN